MALGGEEVTAVVHVHRVVHVKQQVQVLDINWVHIQVLLYIHRYLPGQIVVLKVLSARTHLDSL